MSFELDKKVKQLINISVFLVVLNCFASNLGLYQYRTSPALLVSAGILTFLAIKTYYIEKCLERMPYYILVPICLMGIAYGLAGLVFVVPTYVLDGYIFALQLPLLYVCLKKGHMKEIIKAYCNAYLILSALALLVCMLLSPLTGEQYQGIFNNPNLLGEYLSGIAMCVIYMYEEETIPKKRIVYLLIFGLSVAFTIFSRSRTTMLAYALLAVVYLIYILKTKGHLWKRLIAFLLAIIIAVPGTYFILSQLTPVISDTTGIVLGTGGVVSDSDSLSEEIENTADRLFKGVNDGSSFSSGRVEIWQTYLKNLSLKGHAPGLLTFYYYGEYHQANAHNSFLHVAYQSGLLSGIAFIFIFGIMCIHTLKHLAKKNYSNESLFAMCVLANALPYILLSNAVGPYTAFSLLAYWIVVIPYYSMMGKKK